MSEREGVWPQAREGTGRAEQLPLLGMVIKCPSRSLPRFLMGCTRARGKGSVHQYGIFTEHLQGQIPAEDTRSDPSSNTEGLPDDAAHNVLSPSLVVPAACPEQLVLRRQCSILLFLKLPDFSQDKLPKQS